ncbi:MAG: hypothetical protein HOI02_11090, partial [Rhodospirillaceae bacterium]|nr:hypothetical protein [Rhodospirillaceae bacterium]
VSYGQAKLANVLMANELQRKFGAQGLSACSLHPGTLITTDIGRRSLFMSIVMKLVSPLTKSPSQGASTTICCALQDADRVAGKYFSDCQPHDMSEEARLEAGITPLPESLDAALEAFKTDEVVRGWFSDDLYQSFMSVKSWEADYARSTAPEHLFARYRRTY